MGGGYIHNVHHEVRQETGWSHSWLAATQDMCNWSAYMPVAYALALFWGTARLFVGPQS